MSDKKKRGRPPLPPEEVRSRRLVIHLTEAEYAQAAACAAVNGVRVGDWARRMVLQALGRD